MGMVEVKNVTKQYGKSVTALRDVSLSLETNRFYGIKGHSGSGKTTLLQIIGLLDGCTSGELYINGENTVALSEGERSDLRMDKIGFIFQSYYLNEKLKAFENVMLPMYINRKLKDKERFGRAMELLKRLGLEERANHYPKQLSGGEQQRVAIARALANDPELILADEPTGNLDSENEIVVFDILKSLSQAGKCVLVVSHNEIIAEYADTLYLMEGGRLAGGDRDADQKYS